jgi:hypothetical protein
LQGFEFAAKTAAATRQNRNIMPKIGVYTFHIVRIALIPDVANVDSILKPTQNAREKSRKTELS